MFREWREVTKAIIKKKKAPKFRYALTKRYVQWAEKKFKYEPLLFERFNEGKGIIFLRNLFLKEEGHLEPSFGETVVKMAAKLKVDDKSDNSDEKECMKILIMPVATIGSGKTTLARMLMKFFPNAAHVQNDNITGKNTRRKFEEAIIDQFYNCDIVIAGDVYFNSRSK